MKMQLEILLVELDSPFALDRGRQTVVSQSVVQCGV